MTRTEELARLVRLSKRAGLSHFEIGRITGYSSASVKRWGDGIPPKDMEGLSPAIKKRIRKHLEELMKEASDLGISVGYPGRRI